MPTVSEAAADPAFDIKLFWERYKMVLIAVAALIVLAGLSYAGFELYKARRAANAAALLANASTAEQFQEVIQRYPGTEPAATAYLLLAQEQRAKKNYEQANATLRKFIAEFPKHSMITTAWMGLAANLQSLGKDDEALSTYQRLVSDYPQSFNAPLALLAEVPLLKARNRIDEARKALETVISQYHDNILAAQAFQEMMALPKPEATPAPAQEQEEIPMARPPETPAPSAKP
jgi:TolA-binding protein